ncbi:APH(3')-I family aminoglycoside O-phosphotransferase [Sphingomonas sp. Leaf4]|uniref:APH(3')-I family aminoglycoside O-phosphotransferase n=1 Tax=Sphingomonas sp. Leaf4 TaxID=2876553 RepID=UPI001E3AFC9F|nr:APH(3')-I family aminoglycoside O-phosphotransferase [Sphingomonas sp. Leaf4]
MDREIPCAPVDVPPGIAEAVAGYGWARDLVGESGGAVYRLHGRPGAADLFLKHGTGPVADDIADEMIRLRWLAGRMPVPGVVRFVAADNAAWLLTTALAGETAYQALSRRPGVALVDALVAFLRRLHAIPVVSCPFASDHKRRMAAARARIDAGQVDEEDFDDERLGWSAAQVWTAMRALLPLTLDAVVTHGDFSLDNLLVQGGVVVGCIDVARAGVADRYQDLAILSNCLGEFGPGLQEQMFAAYGIAEPDTDRLTFHLLLDELF